MSVFEQDEAIKEFRRQGIRMHNIKELQSGSNEFLRQRKAGDNDDLPFMCSGCKGFFSKSYKTRHQQVCSSSSLFDLPQQLFIGVRSATATL